MNRAALTLTWMLETAGRFLPFPCRPGLRAVGAPGPDAPVLVTGNYHLTVVRLRRALRGLSCWLLVVDSGGINVWCAAAGGRLTDHRVISALKTCGIERRVRHRRLILPQLAAAGIRAAGVMERSGWRCDWGPVYAADIREYLRREGGLNPGLREVRFPWPQRLEMALATAFPLGLLTTLVLIVASPALIPSFLSLVFAVSTLVWLGFPLYAERLLRPSQPGRHARRRGRRLFLTVWGTLTAAFPAGAFLLPAAGPRSLLLHIGFASLLALLLAADLPGGTPLYGSSLHAEKNFRVALDRSRCRGGHDCVRVCPRGCFTARPGGVTLRRPERCIRCGACIVQCGSDALCFRDPGGRVISPRQVRQRKLGLSGRRSVGVG